MGMLCYGQIRTPIPSHLIPYPQALMPAPPVHLSFLNPVPLTSLAQLPAPAPATSACPVSLPTTYPAEKLSALTSTTTPALTTHVSSVGLISSMIGPVRRAFLTARRSLLLLRTSLRLERSEGVLLDRGDEGAAEDSSRMSPRATDSGTRRSVLGSTRDEPGC
jgi:hypothetical protein